MEILISLLALSCVVILATNLSRPAKQAVPSEDIQSDESWPTPFSFI